MAARKPKKHPQLNDKSQIRVVFGKLAEGSISLKFKIGNEFVRSRVFDEDNGFVITAFSQEDIERLGIKIGALLSVIFYYEGKEYYGTLRVVAAGRYQTQSALRFQNPDVLHIRDDFGLTNFNVSPRVEVTFTNMFGQFCTGSLVNIGPEGIDIVQKERIPTKEVTAVERTLDIAFNLDALKIYCKGTVLYINQVGEELIGIEFLTLDDKTKAAIGKWIQEKTAIKVQKERSWLATKLFGGEKKDKAPQTTQPSNQTLRLTDDYPTVYQEGSPYVLLLSRDENAIARIGKCLKRKYGMLVSKGRFSNVREIIGHYKPDLVLISATLGTISGFDLVGTITDQMPDAPALVVLGDEANAQSGARTAIEKGALGYWAVEPFRPLSFFKSVEDTLQLLTPDLSDADPQPVPIHESASDDEQAPPPQEPASSETPATPEPAQTEAEPAPAAPEEEVDPELLGIIDLKDVKFFD